jgi:hypothetical protein
MLLARLILVRPAITGSLLSATVQPGGQSDAFAETDQMLFQTGKRAIPATDCFRESRRCVVRRLVVGSSSSAVFAIQRVEPTQTQLEVDILVRSERV